MDPIVDASNITMYQVDVFMKDSLEKYLNGDKQGGYLAEVHAFSIIDYLAGQGVPEAKAVIPFLLKPSEIDTLANLERQMIQANSLLLDAKKQLNTFDYETYKTTYGIDPANQRKTTLESNVTQYELAKRNATQVYDTEFRRITSNYSERAANYEDIRGAAYAATTTDPVVQMNRVVFDVNRAYPETSYSGDTMNEQLKSLFDNYNTDVSYMKSIHSLMTDISDNLLNKVEHGIEVKKRQQEIEEYYHKQYNQQIFLLKIVILFSLIALIGCLFYHYRLMTSSMLAIYLGTVSATGFMVLFYYLWDFYIRDTKVFDEYEFSAYLPPSTEGKTLNSGGAFKDNIIYC